MSDESDVEKKPQSNRSFYLLGLFILIGLIGLTGQYLYWKYKGATKETNITAARPMDNKLSLAIHDYDHWTETLPDQKMNVDHDLTSKGLIKIRAVLEAFPDSFKTSQSAKVQRDITTVGVMADSITYNWKSGRHADMIKIAFLKTLGVVTEINDKQHLGAETEITALRLKADAIDKKTLTLNQRDAVKDAFRQTDSLFKKIESGLQLKNQVDR